MAHNISTALGEVFGETQEARICPNQRIAIVRPSTPIQLLNLCGERTAMALGALPSLATGDHPRPLTQEWARAIFEDQPVADQNIRGVYYNAAYTNGRALALWNTDEDVVTDNRNGQVQDFALRDMKVRSRIAKEANSIGVGVTEIDACDSCE